MKSTKKASKETKSVKTVKNKKKPIKTTKVKTKSTKSTFVRYKKVTKGVHYHGDGQVVKFGGILQCEKSFIPSKQFKRHFVCLDNVPKKKEDKGELLRIEKTKSGKYNVLNSKTGKPINDEELEKEDAEQLSGLTIKE